MLINRRLNSLLIVTLILIPNLALFANSSSYEPQTTDKNHVTITVTPLTLGNLNVDEFSFAVRMNTHSVDLGFDLKDFAILKNDKGELARAASWTGEAGGHHVMGTLSFKTSALKNSHSVSLTIAVPILGVRTYVWTLPKE